MLCDLIHGSFFPSVQFSGEVWPGRGVSWVTETSFLLSMGRAGSGQGSSSSARTSDTPVGSRLPLSHCAKSKQTDVTTPGKVKSRDLRRHIILLSPPLTVYAVMASHPPEWIQPNQNTPRGMCAMALCCAPPPRKKPFSIRSV